MKKTIFVLLCLLAKLCVGYKPVVLIHGILTGAESMLIIDEEIKRHHPGTKVYVTDRFSGWSSLENAWHQVQEIGHDVLSLCEKHPDGINLIGYSQGGLISRSILQAFPEHCVDNFISLSSPQAGQYGTAFLHLIFPNLASRTAFEVFYSRVGQHTSVGNYWNDPHRQQLFYKYSNFLPYVNNEIRTDNSTGFRNGILKLKRMVLIGGPDDGVITPWESSHFGYFNDQEEVVNLFDRPIFLNDSIGLKTLNDTGRLTIVTVPKVSHFDWHLNIHVIQRVILPYLD